MRVLICIYIFSIFYTINRVSACNWRPTDLSYTSYKKTPYCSPSEKVRHPKTVFEVQAIVLEAILFRKTVKAFGSRHSDTDIICTDGIPISMARLNSSFLNKDNTVTFGAGIQIKAASEFLQARNRSLGLLPSYGGATVGGAVGSGSHASSLKNAPSLSQQVVKLTIVNGLGQIKTIEAVENLKIMKIHLGLLGIVTSLTFETVPLSKMTLTQTLEPDSILSDGTAIELAKVSDYCQIQWFPSKEQVVVIRGIYTDVNTPGNADTTFFPETTEAEVTSTGNIFDAIQETRNTNALLAIENNSVLSLYETVIGGIPICTEDGLTFSRPCTGYTWRLVTSQCGNSCSWFFGGSWFEPGETEMASEVNELPEIVKTIKGILGKIPAAFPSNGIAVRFHKESDAIMSIANRGPSVIIQVGTPPNRKDNYNDPMDGLGAYQAIAQALLKKHGGRPHWGKNGMYYFSRDVLKESAPNRQIFIEAMKKYDPKGVFLNKFGRRLLDLRDEMDLDPKETHCALHDNCICTSDSNCADEQECTGISDVDGILTYSVCKDLQTFTNKPLGPYDPYNLSSIFEAIF